VRRQNENRLEGGFERSMGARGALNALSISRLDRGPRRITKRLQATRATIESTSSDHSRALI